jgi:hypothetical protein
MKTSIVSCSLAIGLLLFATTGPTSANLIVNGDFETGTFAGWTTTPAPVGSFFGVGPLPLPHDTLSAFFAATGPDFDSISQTFVTTPGAFYDLSFFYQVVEPGSPPDNGLRVLFNGELVFENLNAISGFGTFSFPHLQATGGTTTVEFQGRNVRNADFIDDVSVTGSAGCDPQVVSFSENFDGVTPPTLPPGWTATQGVNSGGFPFWVTSNAGVPAPPADTLPNALFTPDPEDILDNRIDSPNIPIATASAQLTFRHNFNLEESEEPGIAFDAGVLEISINGAAFTDIITAGGSFVSGGYNHTGIDPSHGNPLLPSRPNWSGVSNDGSGGFQTTVVNLPAAAAGQSIVLRWRMGSDDSASRDGWRVDSVSISECPPTPCVRGQGYWKNHPDQWPVTQLLLGNNAYDKEQLLSILHQPVRGNGLVLLAHQLIAAKLNIANGADGSCIEETLADADALIGDLLVPPVGDGYLRPRDVSALTDILDDYNQGALCAPSCDHELRTARARPAVPPRP